MRGWMRKRALVVGGRIFSGILLMLVLLPRPARAWWNEEWKARKQFSVDTSAAGAEVTEPIGAAAVLVRLHAGNFKLDGLKDDGSDLRVIAADDKTPLKFHVERFDPLLGEALVWVGIPDLKPGARTSFFIYSGNPKAAAAEDAKGTYESGTALVYHFSERGQPPRDSSSGANHALNAGQSAEGTNIGRGLRLDGTSPITISGSPSLAWSAGGKMTWSAWLKPAEANANGVIFSRRDGAAALVIGLQGGKPFVEVSGQGGAQRASATASIPADKWRHLALVAGSDIALYLDGARVGSVSATLPALAGPSLLGGDTAQGSSADAGKATKGDAPLAGFKGELDELQIARVERPAGFIRIAAIGQGADPGRLIVAGQDEQSASWSSGYFTIIIQSVTLDGWVVIGFLAVMAVVSWIVMASKASYVSRTERTNGQFAARFREASGNLARFVERGRDPAAQAGAKTVDESPLQRIFLASATAIRNRTDGTRPLYAEEIAAIRAGLDSSLMLENQRLNSNMVLLTIAIAGGPFLGLLGTVVGVMITFASIAAAGDVNVNAIAPGIAAALVATVAGLAVAIPALFGYNWLLTRIKSCSNRMQVFVDELVTGVAEAYCERVIARDGADRSRLAAAE